MAYAAMLCRDLDRLADVKKRMNVLPLGSGALAGTTYPIDRQMVAAQLDFDDVSANSLDGVSDRDFCIELAAALSLVMVHLSRFSEEIIMWCSWELSLWNWTTPFPPVPALCPKRKTRTSPSWYGAKAAAFRRSDHPADGDEGHCTRLQQRYAGGQGSHL